MVYCLKILTLPGGTFALYSLICRYAKVSRLPNQQRADEDISSFRLKLPTPELERALRIKENLEKKSSSKTLLLLLVLMGTSMIIGDGILTPSMSGNLLFFNKLGSGFWLCSFIIICQLVYPVILFPILQ